MATDVIGQRRNIEEEVMSAWLKLAKSKEWQTVWEHDLQRKFNPLKNSFSSSDQWNPVPAAIREGNKEVIAHIGRRLGIALAISAEEQIQRPKTAKAEFQGLPENTP